VTEGELAIVKQKMTNSHYATYFDTVEEARQRLRDNTNLSEHEDGKFITQDAEEELGILESFILVD
jgi:hypothetical protein